MKLLKHEGGAAALETALVLPFYLAMIFFIAEVGYIYWTYTSMQYAVDEAARCAVVQKGNGVCDTTSEMVSFLQGKRAVLMGTANIGVAVTDFSLGSCDMGNGVAGTTVTITHQITAFAPLLSYFAAPPLNLATASCYPL